MRAMIDGAVTPVFLSSGAEDYFLSAFCEGPPPPPAHRIPCGPLRTSVLSRWVGSPARVPLVAFTAATVCNGSSIAPTLLCRL